MVKINIALGATQEWLKFTRVTVASILLNASLNDDYHFFIMCDKFTKKDKELFEKLNLIKDAQFDFITMNNKDFEGAIHDWLGVSSSYRLKLPSLLKEDKVLYLDSDIVVLKDIAELYNHDISDYYIAAIEDKLGDFMKPRVKMSEHDTFINGGVQLMNLKAFRENSLENTIFDLLRKSTFWTDQDVINYVCNGHVLSLPLKYNLMPVDDAYLTRREEFEETLKDPFILHFTVKPWKEANIPFASYWNRYNDYLEEILYPV